MSDVLVTPIFLDRVIGFETAYAHIISAQRDDVIELLKRIRDAVNKYVEGKRVQHVVVIESLMNAFAETCAIFLLDLEDEYDEMTSKEVCLALQKLLGMKLIYYMKLLKEERGKNPKGIV